jgi:hypothetical protein
MKRIFHPSFLTFVLANLFLLGFPPVARATIPPSLQGDYHLRSFVVTVNGHVHRIPLSAAAKAYPFPVTGDTLGKLDHGLIYSKIGLRWTVKIRKDSSTSLTGTIVGDFRVPGTRFFVLRGTLAIRLSRFRGGTLLYRATLRGYRQRGERREPFYLTLNLILQKETS